MSASDPKRTLASNAAVRRRSAQLAPVVREYVAPPVVYDDVDVIYDDVDIIYAPAPRAPYYTGW